jgi:arsenate reductase (thioredoxin)
MNKLRVLFLCSANTSRSQMAEALLRHHGEDRFEVISAGLEPGVVNPFAIQAIEEMGLSLEGHRAKAVKDFLGQSFHYLITVCSNAEEKCPIFPGVIYRLYWPFEDPAALVGSDPEKRAKFREVRDQIDAQIQTWVEEISSKKIIPAKSV